MRNFSKLIAAALLFVGGGSVASAQMSLGDRTFRIYQVNSESGELEEVYQSFRTELTMNFDGSFRIADFCGTGAHLDFAIENYAAPDDYGYEYAGISFPSGEDSGNNCRESTSGANLRYRFWDWATASWIKPTLVSLDGETSVTIAKPYIYESADKEDGSKFWYSQSARWTEDGEEVEQVYIDLYGTDTGVNGNSNNNYIYFFISDEPAEWTAGVEDMIVDDENAPVEYFNLQGVRVENPENGIFIRRQGSKTSKVAL